MQLSDFDAAPISSAVPRPRRRARRAAVPLRQARRRVAAAELGARPRAQVCLLAEALRALGLEHGDRVVLVSENRPEWASPTSRSWPRAASPCPAYTTNTERDHLHILENSGAQGGDRLDRTSWPSRCCPAMRPLGHRRARDRHRAAARRRRAAASTATTGTTCSKATPPRRAPAVEARIAGDRARATRPASSTPAAPAAPRAGCMQHHGAILRNVDGARRSARRAISAGTTSAFLSFLPLSHAYEHTGGQYLPIGAGRARSTTPKGSRSSPAISRRRARRSWSWCRGCSRCCARGS